MKEAHYRYATLPSTGSGGWDRTNDILINSQTQLPLCYSGINWSEWCDSNTRFPAPKAGGMTGLSYTRCKTGASGLNRTDSHGLQNRWFAINRQRRNLVDRWRIELQPPPCKGGVLPLSLAAQFPAYRIQGYPKIAANYVKSPDLENII